MRQATKSPIPVLFGRQAHGADRRSGRLFRCRARNRSPQRNRATSPIAVLAPGPGTRPPPGFEVYVVTQSVVHCAMQREVNNAVIV